MNKWYFSKSLKNVCNFLFLGVSTELPELLQYLEAEEPTSLEDRLIDAHEKGYQFIIETVWDFGYDVFLLKKNGDVCELREFNSYEVNEVVDWIDLQTNAISIKGDQSQIAIAENRLKISTAENRSTYFHRMQSPLNMA
jgi:hypothetical protein